MGKWILEHKAISIGGGLALLIGLGQIFSDTVKQHPHWAYLSAAIALLMIFVPLLVGMKPSNDATALDASARNTATGGVKGYQIGNVRGDLNVYPPAQVLPELDPHTHSKIRETTGKSDVWPPIYPSLNLQGFGFENFWFHPQHGQWHHKTDIEEGQQGCFAVVKNPIPTERGGVAICLSRIYAHITYGLASGGGYDVDRAYWIGKRLNWVSLEAASSLQVLLGLISPEGLEVFSNGKVSDFEVRTSRRPITHRRPLSITLPLDSPIQMRLTIMDKQENIKIDAIDYVLKRGLDGVCSMREL